jgi:hypothetical protein
MSAQGKRSRRQTAIILGLRVAFFVALMGIAWLESMTAIILCRYLCFFRPLLALVSRASVLRLERRAGALWGTAAAVSGSAPWPFRSVRRLRCGVATA